MLQTHDKEAPCARELGEALSAQEVIGRAGGILMERDSRSADEALQILQARAEDLKKKINVAADQVIASSEREREELKLPEGFGDRCLAAPKPSAVALAGRLLHGSPPQLSSSPFLSVSW